MTVGGAALGLLVLVACGGDDNGGGSGNSGTAPTSCPAMPCTVGAICYQPAPNANCNGTWYCWSDQKWYCAPEESGGPGDATITFEAGEPEAGDDSATPTGDAEAGAVIEAGASETGAGGG